MDTAGLKKLLTGLPAKIGPQSAQGYVDVAGLFIASGLAYADAADASSSEDHTALSAETATALSNGLTWLVVGKVEDDNALTAFLEALDMLLIKKAKALAGPEALSNISIALCRLIASHTAKAIVAMADHTEEEADAAVQNMTTSIQNACVQAVLGATLGYYLYATEPEAATSE